MRARRAGLPKISSVPLEAWSRSAIRRSSVDLPHPDGPMSETNSPAPTSSSTPARAITLFESVLAPVVGKILPTPTARTARSVAAAVAISFGLPCGFPCGP